MKVGLSHLRNSVWLGLNTLSNVWLYSTRQFVNPGAASFLHVRLTYVYIR